MPRSTNKLAYALATPEPLSRQYFRNVFDHLYLTDAAPAGYKLDDIDWHRRTTESNLEALSICDFEFRDRQTVQSCPPYLGLLPHAGFPVAVLFGARTPSILQRLRAAARERRREASFEVSEQPGFPLLPHRISIQTKDIPAMRAIAEAASISLLGTTPSWLLLSYAHAVEAHAAILSWKASTPDLNWRRDDFDIQSLSFSGISPDTPRLTRYRHPQQKHRHVYYLVDGERSAEVEPTWARYYILHRYNENMLLYDEQCAIALLPASLPLPRLLGRGLVMCSGFAPQEVPAHDGRRLRAFVQVPQSHAELLACKLGQQLTRTRLVELPRNIDD